MNPSNSTKLSVLLVSFSVALVLSGCNLPEPKEARDSDGSTFAVSSFEGKVNSISINKKTGLPSANTYDYKVCLTDLRQNKPMIGHKFQIVEIEQDLSTDVNGCLFWSETVNYNYLAQSKYLKIARTIKGLGPHFGVRPVHFAIDPWSHGEAKPKDAIDLVKSTVSPELLINNADDVKASLLGNSLSQKKTPSQLWLSMIRLASTEDRITGKGFEINYDFQATPQVKLSRMTGEQTFSDLTSGQMKGKMQLIHVVLENGKIERKVLASKDYSDLQIDNKVIALGAHFNFEAPYWGHLYLGIQLTPMQALSDLAPFEGVFYLGDYRSVSSGGFLLLSSLVQKNPHFSVEQFIAGKYPINTEAEVAPKKDSSSVSSDAMKRGEKEDFNGKNQVAIAALTFSGARIDEDSAHRRTLKYQAQACLAQPINHEPIRGRAIEVTPFRTSESQPAKTISSLVTQMDGCVTWPEEMIVDTYACQKYVKGFVELKSPDLGINRKINVFVNPWLTTYEIGVDELKFRDLIGHECDGKKEIEKPSYIFINSFQYNLMSLKHDIDSNLNLVVKRELQMDLDLTLVNNSNLRGPRDGNERLRDGLYLVKSVLTENPDMSINPRFISSHSSIVQSRAGHITISPLTYNFRNPVDLGNRNRLLVQILPVNSEKVTLSTDLKSWIPKNGNSQQDFQGTVDLNARLLPIIYEAKIILMGENTRANLVDNQRVILEAVMAGKTEFQKQFNQTLAERKKTLDMMIAVGEQKQKDELKVISDQSSLATYARQLSLVLINSDETSSSSLKYLERLLALDLNKYFHNATSGFEHRDPRALLAKSIKDTKSLTKDQALSLIRADKISADVAKRICIYYMTELLAPALSSGGKSAVPLYCSDRMPGVAEKLLVREKVYHVNKFNHFKYISGHFENMAVSNSFALSYTFTDSHSHTASTSFGVKVPDFFFIGGGAQTSLAWTKQTAESSSNTINVTSGLPLRKQVSQAQFDLLDYDSCYRIRINPELFLQKVGFFEKMDVTKLSFYNFLDHKKPAQEVFNILNRGLLICERPKNMKPLRKVENFYVIQQDPTAGEIQDSGNPMNRFLFLSLRGQDQFNHFEMMTKTKIQLPRGTKLSDMTGDESNRQLLKSFQFKPWSPRIYTEPSTKN